MPWSVFLLLKGGRQACASHCNLDLDSWIGGRQCYLGEGGGGLAPVSGWATFSQGACPTETPACRGCQSPLYAGHLHCADVHAAPLYMPAGEARHAAPLSHKHASQSATQWILESVQINPCKHIPQAIGDLDRLTSPPISFVQETEILLLRCYKPIMTFLFSIPCTMQLTKWHAPNVKWT